MNRNISIQLFHRTGECRPTASFWKRAVLVAAAALLVIGLAGCSLDDIMAPMAGEIPFEGSQTKPTDMGAVDIIPTVPDDASFDNIDDRPL